MEPTQPVSSLDELIKQRREKLKKARENGVNPFPTTFAVTHTANAVRLLCEPLSAEGQVSEEVAVAGRLMTRRDMGKAAFAHLQDRSGKIQLYLRKDELGDAAYDLFKNQVDLGDILGVTGMPFKTKTGEPSIRVKTCHLLSKALRPPPEKFHGMTDVEVRYRRREVDLFSNEEARTRFWLRRKIVTSLREVLDKDGFIEVETPMMQPVPGGAAAKPFITHHETLDMDLYMRVAPELYLKRLLVGGLERVYEIGRAFRNEGIDTRHNPEFTILEAYQAYTDFQGMRFLTEKIIDAAAKTVIEKTWPTPEKGSLRVDVGPMSLGPELSEGNKILFPYRGRTFSLYASSYPGGHFPWLSMGELFKEHLGLDYRALCRDNNWKEAAKKAGVSIEGNPPDHKFFDALFDQKILPHLPAVAFVHGYPAVFSPLAKCAPESPDVAERFELFICGDEVANAFSEQNDPDVQRKHFIEQARQRQAGDEEAMPADEEFVIALEHGMPPAGGLGIGVDRLTMILTGTESIREVILFPLLRPEKNA
ncbi:MAG TPA: lysine--tRNA ligase [Elusimicrobiota bacterium]|nr:lysine--tRNA ligase [Elusimicrobiota bacterium]